MATLSETVSTRGMMSEKNIAAALERQSIYGGSLDTLLYEQNLLVEEALIELLEVTSGLAIVPVSMLLATEPRPFDSLPAALLDTGWLVPVGTPDALGIVCHPETSDDVKAQANEAAPHARLYVVPECVLAKLTGERVGSIVPQRYALLAERFTKFLSGRAGGVSDSAPPPTTDHNKERAPTMLGIPSAFGPQDIMDTSEQPAAAPIPSFVPPPAAIPVKPSPDLPFGIPLPSMAGLPPTPSAPGGAPLLPSLAPSAPAPSTDSGLQIPSLLRPVDDAKQTLLGNLPPGMGPNGWPATSDSNLSDLLPPDDPASEVPTPNGDDTKQRALALADAHRRLASASDRDEITISLVQAVATQCPRVVLFSVRKAGLIALEIEGTIESARGLTIPLEGELGKAVAGTRTIDAVRDLDLRIAVQLERADPCVFCPVRVQERTVLAIYADCKGAEIDAAARATIASLAETAAERLIDVLVRRRRPADASSTPTPAANDSAAGAHSADSSIRAKVAIRDEVSPNSQSGAHDQADSDPGEPLDALISRVVAGESPVSELAERGQDAVRRVMATFPGTIVIEARQRSSVANPSEHGPLLNLCVQMGTVVSDELINYMESSHEATRLYAAFCFQEIRDSKCMPELAKLAFDSSSEVRSVSIRVLETYSKADGFESTTGEIHKELHSTNITRQLHAIKACGILRDVNAIPRLIEMLAARDEYLQDSVIESLCTITAQQLGTKAHRWQNWYHDQGARHRIQWLIGSLRHRDRNVRAWSGEELRRITGAAIVFPVDGDRGQREAGVRQWDTWWDQECQRRFGT